MIKIYCDNGGYRKVLSALERESRIMLIMFPYENINSKIAHKGMPSETTWNDLNNFTWGSMPGSWKDYVRSEKYRDIYEILGHENEKDAKHLDAAYKNGCVYFFTRDKGDIISKREKLESFLGIKIRHPDIDWDMFLMEIAQ